MRQVRLTPSQRPTCKAQVSRRSSDTVAIHYASTADEPLQLKLRDGLSLEMVTAGHRIEDGRVDVVSTDSNRCEVIATVDGFKASHVSDESLFVPLPWVRSGQEVEYEVDGKGHAGDRYAYLGTYEMWTQSSPHRSIELVVPDTVESLAAPKREILNLFVETDRYLNVAQSPNTTTVFVADWSIRADGLALGSDCVIQSTETVGYEDVTNTWIHEAVHTHQLFNLQPEMEWLKEATARHLEMRINHDLGRQNRVAYEEKLREMAEVSYPLSVLADPDRWYNGVEYEKGALLVVALDQYVRTCTHGGRDFSDVVAEVNRRCADGQRLSIEDFIDVLESVTRHPLIIDLDRYVRTSDVPEAPHLDYELTVRDRVRLLLRDYRETLRRKTNRVARQFREGTDGQRTVCVLCAAVILNTLVRGEKRGEEGN